MTLDRSKHVCISDSLKMSADATVHKCSERLFSEDGPTHRKARDGLELKCLLRVIILISDKA